MASELSDPAGTGTQAISFAVDALAQDADGRVEITGRWFRIRGRRFVRPTLTAALKSGGSERRALADLDHKPWASEDGEPWTAAFQLGIEIEDAAELELSVAPDITIVIDPETAMQGAARRGKPGSGRGRTSPGARAPRVRTNPPARPAIADRAQETQRLRGRLADLEAAHGRERSRREQAEFHLEEQRTEALRLRSDVGRLGAELDLAVAARPELEAAAAELETTRQEAVSTGRELAVTRHTADQTNRQLKTAREHARDVGRALESARSETIAHERQLHETRRELDETQRERDALNFALVEERAENERLRRELTEAEDAVRRLAGSRSGMVSRARPVAGGSEPGAAGSSEPANESHFPSRARAAEHRLEPMSPRLRALNNLEGSSAPWADRPLNPSLRSPGNWVVRGLAVVGVLIVLVAILLVIKSTVA